MRSPSEWRDAYGYRCTACGYDRWGEPIRWRAHRLCLGCVLAILEDTPLRYANDVARCYSLSPQEWQELCAEYRKENALTYTADPFMRSTKAPPTSPPPGAAGLLADPECFAPNNPQAESPSGRQSALWDYVDKQFVPDLPTGWIEEWEHNPRKTFDDAALGELAASIRAEGVQQPIVVRLTGVIGAGNLRRPVLQVVMGERRLRASRLAEKATIPAIVRVGMDNHMALRLAVVENTKRADLNPVEEAKAFHALMRQGDTQETLADLLHLSRSFLANRLRLLRLPEEVLDHISEGRMTVSQALPLLRYGQSPLAVRHLARTVVSEGLASRLLEAKEWTGTLADVLDLYDLPHGKPEEPELPALELNDPETESDEQEEADEQTSPTRETAADTPEPTEPLAATESAVDAVLVPVSTAPIAPSRPDTSGLLRKMDAPIAAASIPVIDKREERTAAAVSLVDTLESAVKAGDEDGSASDSEVLAKNGTDQSVGDATTAIATPAARLDNAQGVSSSPSSAAPGAVPPARTPAVERDRSGLPTAPASSPVAATQPVAPSPSPAPAPASAGGYVTALLPRAEQDWLTSQGLTVGVAIAELRELRTNGTGYVLSAGAQDVLTRLTDQANREHSAKRTESDQLEIILTAHARKAGLLTDEWSDE